MRIRSVPTNVLTSQYQLDEFGSAISGRALGNTERTSTMTTPPQMGGSRLRLGRGSDRRRIEMFARITSGALAHMRALLLLAGLASCTGSPAALALQPDFEVMTPPGVASVSIRQSPPGMTQAEF